MSRIFCCESWLQSPTILFADKVKLAPISLRVSSVSNCSGSPESIQSELASKLNSRFSESTNDGSP